MKVCLGSASVHKPLCGALTMGVFDGLHIGHQKLIHHSVALSKKYKIPSILYTFNPHPLSVLKPHLGVKRLFSMESMKNLTREWGLDYLIIEMFDQKFSQLSAKQFFDQYIYQAIRPRFITVGEDFQFGFQRSGGLHQLEQWQKMYQFTFQALSAVSFNQTPVSTSGIRIALKNADLALLKKLLGRSLIISGTVIKGKSRKIGYPTANIDCPSMCLSKTGVYVCQMQISNQWYNGVMNVGVCPTFNLDPSEAQIEVHLLSRKEFHLVGERVKIKPLLYLREEKKFNNSNELTSQIQKDIQKATVYFGHLQVG